MLETHKEESRNCQSAVERWGVMHGHRVLIENSAGLWHQPQEKEAKRERDWILRKRRGEDNSGKEGKGADGLREGIRKWKAVEGNQRVRRRETRRL